MSNSLAVAMVTAALRRILGEALVGVPAGGVENARVTTLRPDMLDEAEQDGRGINIFLYQVTPNAALNCSDLPARREDGTAVARPRQALNLRYLLTFSGDESTLEPQRMLGVAMSTLAGMPVLSGALVREIVGRDQADDPSTWEQYSDLADQIDAVRFTFQSIGLDELSTHWSTFFNAPYRLSVTYQASVVLLDYDLVPQPALPVRDRGTDVAAAQRPTITRIVADSAPADPIVPGTLLRIEGEQLRGAYATLVRVEDVDVLVPDAQVTRSRLTLALPAGVGAGVRGVQVRHPRMAGSPPVELVGMESDIAAIIVRPAVGAPVTATPGTPGSTPGAVEVVVPVAPPVQRGQRVVLLLNKYLPADDPASQPVDAEAAAGAEANASPDASPSAYAFAAPPIDPAGPEQVGTITVVVSGVAAGTYLVRLRVDGAESMLRTGTDGRYAEPTVVIP
ncbi:MAG: DUF4255 domain-containing protein [Micromonosporaceae bacterium]|nr:DUF4255 domain-containing protein [Micromonosporaceae bacterium]